MKILQVTDFYWPHVGGVEQHVRSLAHALASRGHQITVATLHADSSLPAVEDDGPVSVIRLRSSAQRLGLRFVDEKRPWAPPLPDPALSIQLARLAAERQPEVIHGHDWMARSAWLACHRQGAALVLTLHYFTRPCALKTLIRNGAPCEGPSLGRCLPCTSRHYGTVKGPLVYFANRLGAATDDHLAASFIAVSRSTAKLNGFGQQGSPRCDVVPNLLADALGGPTEWDPAMPALPTGPFVLYVGDLRHEKGVSVLFEAYRRGTGLPSLVVVGKRSPAETIEVPAGVIRLGPMANAHIRSLMGRALMLVVPSVWPEPFSIVAIEAMAAGTPVVASAVGGLAEVVVDGKVGLLVPPNDPDALRAAIERLASDEDLTKRLGRVASEYVRRYRPELVAEEVERIYHRALSESG